MIDRHQFFEFCDMPWVKGVVREGYLDCLDNIHRFLQPYRHIAPLISEWASRSGTSELLDIGSGGGEQIATILQQLEEQGLDAPHFVLSDLYPNPKAWEALERRFGSSRLGYLKAPVDISDIPDNCQFLTIFSAFHHFPPEQASALLREVVAHRGGISIVEFTRRTWLDILSMIPAFFMNMLAPLTAKRFRIGKLLLGTIIPVIPAMVTFDGIVSALRSYRPEEILQMLPAETGEKFAIDYGEVPWGRLTVSKATYVQITRR